MKLTRKSAAARRSSADWRRRGRIHCLALGEIRLQHALELLRQIGHAHVAPQLAAERALVAGAAADHHAIALDHVVALRDLDAEQADIADIVLGAGMRAAGEVDVDRLVERDAFVEMLGQRHRVALGVGGGEFAAGIAGAGDQRAANGGGAPIEAEGDYRVLGLVELGRRDASDNEVLPDREPDRLAAIILCNRRQAFELRY